MAVRGLGLDARIGRITREHGDVEFWVERIHAERSKAVLVGAGAKRATPAQFGLAGQVEHERLASRQVHALDAADGERQRHQVPEYAMVTGLARIAGPGVAGIVIAATGETAVFFVDAASFLGVIAVFAWLAGTTGQQDPEASAEAPKPRRLRWLAELPGGVRAAAAMALLVGGFGYQFAVTNPLMAGRVFHLGAAGFGLFGTCMAVGGIAGTYYSSRRGDPGPREFLGWAMLFGAAECLAAVVPSAWAYDAAMVVTGAALQLFAVSATVYIQQATPAAQRGLALSAYNAGFIGFVPAGAFAVAGIASAAGVRWALIGPGLAVLAGGGALAIAARPRRPGGRNWLAAGRR